MPHRRFFSTLLHEQVTRLPESETYPVTQFILWVWSGSRSGTILLLQREREREQKRKKKQNTQAIVPISSSSSVVCVIFLLVTAASSLFSMLNFAVIRGIIVCVFNLVLAGKVYNYGCNLSPSLWTWSLSPKSNGFGKLGEEKLGSSVASRAIVSNSHCSTVERLYAWEKKLYQEVKTAEKRVAHLRKLELKRVDYVKTEKTKKEVEKLESQMMVASQAIESTSSEIIKLRETTVSTTY